MDIGFLCMAIERFCVAKQDVLAFPTHDSTLLFIYFLVVHFLWCLSLTLCEITMSYGFKCRFFHYHHCVCVPIYHLQEAAAVLYGIIVSCWFRHICLGIKKMVVYVHLRIKVTLQFRAVVTVCVHILSQFLHDQHVFTLLKELCHYTWHDSDSEKHSWIC